MVKLAQPIAAESFFEILKGHPGLSGEQDDQADEQKDGFEKVEIRLFNRLIGGINQQNDNKLNEVGKHMEFYGFLGFIKFIEFIGFVAFFGLMYLAMPHEEHSRKNV